LPADQGMQLGIFVDESRNPSQEAVLFEIFQMLVQIQVSHDGILSLRKNQTQSNFYNGKRR